MVTFTAYDPATVIGAAATATLIMGFGLLALALWRGTDMAAIISKVRHVLADAVTVILGIFIVGILGACFVVLLVLSPFFPASARMLKPRGDD